MKYFISGRKESRLWVGASGKSGQNRLPSDVKAGILWLQRPVHQTHSFLLLPGLSCPIYYLRMESRDNISNLSMEFLKNQYIDPAVR